MYYNNQQITWLDYILLKNPDGIRNILAHYGYPVDNLGYDQARQAALEIMDNYGTEGIISLLKAHPEFGAFQDLFASRSNSFFNNADDSEPGLISRMKSTVKPFDDLFIALSVFTLAFYIVSEIMEKEEK